MSLTQELEERREASRKRIPSDKLTVMDRATRDLRQSGILDSCLKVGDAAPAFVLPNVLGKPIALEDLVRHGPVVISFYRGGW